LIINHNLIDGEKIFSLTCNNKKGIIDLFQNKNLLEFVAFEEVVFSGIALFKQSNDYW